jgi:hypothetical protein
VLGYEWWEEGFIEENAWVATGRDKENEKSKKEKRKEKRKKRKGKKRKKE